MKRLFVCLGYPCAGKSTMADFLFKSVGNCSIIQVDDFLTREYSTELKIKSKFSKKILKDQYGQVLIKSLNFLSDQIDEGAADNIIIDGPFSEPKRRRLLLHIVKNKVDSIYFISIECRDKLVWMNRLSDKNKFNEYIEVAISYRNNFIRPNLYELLQVKNGFNLYIISLDTSRNDWELIEATQNSNGKNFLLNKFKNGTADDVSTLDLEDYKSVTNNITHLEKRNDIFLNINLTLFIAVLSVFIRFLGEPKIHVLLIPIIYVHWISFRYYTANRKLIVAYQAYLKNFYERKMAFGWFSYSQKFRELSYKKKIANLRLRKHFSPDSYYSILLILNTLFLWGSIITKNPFNNLSVLDSFRFLFSGDLESISYIVHSAITIYFIISIAKSLGWHELFEKSSKKWERM
ncbi:AAA family ATPase [Ekhidna sp.]|uniref:AAA family ATPase n=1 Tax=Ekhidna sp. TaxID=2608089 RepID=UPI003BA8C7E0